MLRNVSVCISLCIAAAASAGVNSWTPVGPDGGSVVSVAYHPTTAELVFAVTDKSVYRSEDGGSSWSNVLQDNQFSLAKIVIDPADPNRLLVAGYSVLYLSLDAGRSFSLATSPGTISNLEVSADGGILYAIEATNLPRVFHSEDFGASWQEASMAGFPSGAFIGDFAIDPQDPEVVYALFSSDGLYRSIDGGDNWIQQNALGNLGAARMAIDPADSSRLLIATFSLGLLSSENSGVTWTSELAGRYLWAGYHPNAANGEAIAIARDGPTVRRAGHGMAWTTGESLLLESVPDGDFDPANADTYDSTLMLATARGPLHSADGGASFTVRGQGIRAASVTDIKAARDGSDSLFVVYSTGPVGLHRRSFGVWNAVDNTALEAALATTIDGQAQVAIAPDDADRLFFKSRNLVVDSIDGGQSWTTPHPQFSLNSLYPRAIEFAPADSQVIYVSTDSGGVYRSGNQGTTWQPANAGLPAFIGPIAVSPADADIVYAGTEAVSGSPALFRSIDAGTTWEAASDGLTAESVGAVALGSDSTVYAGGVGTGEGLFASRDSAETWARVGSPAGEDPAVSIAVDPVVPTNLVMAFDANGSAARSVDAGATWESLPQVAPGGIVRIVALDPERSHVILAGVSNHGLVEFEVAADLEVEISGASTLPLGNAGQTTVRVTNNGPYAASALSLQLDAPVEMTVSSATSAQGACAIVGASVSCDLDALQAGSSVDTEIMLVGSDAPAAGMLTARIAAHESDVDSTNDSIGVAIEAVRTADLAVSLVAPATNVRDGDSIELVLIASNQGPNDATDADVDFSIDSRLSFVRVESAQGMCAHDAGTIACELGALASGSETSIAVSATVSGTGTLSSAATIVDASVTDPDGTNDSITVQLTATSPTPAAGGGDSGGGGSVGIFELIALGLLLSMAVRQVSRQRNSFTSQRVRAAAYVRPAR